MEFTSPPARVVGTSPMLWQRLRALMPVVLSTASNSTKPLPKESVYGNEAR